MQIDFLGSDSDFFDRAFFGPFGLNIAVSGVPTSTEIVLLQPNSGATTTITGSGFTFNTLGQITGGTITGTSFFQNGITVANFSDFNWSATAIFAALEDADGDDLTALETLYNSQPITVDASSATAGFNTSNFDIDFTTPIEFIGSGFADRFVGGTGNDNLSGGARNDTIDGGGGDDVIFGGSGDDRLRGGVQGNLLGTGSNTIDGGAGHDSIRGENGADELFGGAKSDIIKGAGGNDRIFGGKGIDSLEADDGNDFVNGGAGFDDIFGGRGQDRLLGGGGGAADRIRGEGGNDKLFGGGGRDEMYGGNGRDKLTGGAGNDSMYGGAGADVFIYNGAKGEGTDRIYDFEDGKDMLRIIDATTSEIVSILASGPGGQNDTTVTLTSGTKIVLVNVDVDDITIDDFQFV